MIKFVLFFVNIFDFFHKRKIISFLKNKLKLEEIKLFIDVGGHKGETIELFCSNFKVEKLISFEASPKNFLILNSMQEKLSKKFSNSKIKIENLGLGSENKTVMIKEFDESSSNTISEIDQNSAYFKKKFRVLNIFKKKNFYTETEIKISKLYDYLQSNNIEKIQFLKIDTEGSEFEILKGIDDKIRDINLIYFEHHFDLMLRKNYKFRDIHNLLKEKKFKKIFKIKMPLRKVFEYIYINEKKEKNKS